MALWPRKLNVLQLQKTHANRKSTSKSRKHYHQFDSCIKCSQHNQMKDFICSAFLCLVCVVFAVHFFICLCCEHFQRVCCKIDQVVFLICRCFFSICSVLSSLGHSTLSSYFSYEKWHLCVLYFSQTKERHKQTFNKLNEIAYTCSSDTEWFPS